MRRWFLSTAAVVSMTTLQGQNKFPDNVDIKDKVELRNQSASFAKQAEPVVKEASKSVVAIQIPDYRGNRYTVAYGTVTEMGIVTKWSEIASYMGEAKIVYPGKKTQPIKLIGVYTDYDLALLSDDLGIPSISFNNKATTELGDFIVSASATGEAASFGVVSVMERSLREEDKAFLGVEMDFDGVAEKGVLLRKIVEESAADIGGLVAGDRLKSIDATILSSAIQTRSVIQNLKPGQKIMLGIVRNGKLEEKPITLGSRLGNKGVPARRMNMMENMGGAISKVRTNFPSVIQSDMMSDKNHMGGAVVDLEGRFVGVTLSRSRMKTHLIPAKKLQDLLKTQPVRKVDLPPIVNQQNNLRQQQQKRFEQGNGRNERIERLQNRLLEMRREMEQMQREMQGGR